MIFFNNYAEVIYETVEDMFKVRTSPQNCNRVTELAQIKLWQKNG